tara:strand:+ start:498 stop:1202 length:705 start_codon:yes stop_codon:yes gene_type:complete
MKYKTELELIKSQIQNLFLLDKMVRAKGLNIYDLCNEIPGIFHTNHVADMTIDHMNEEGEDYCQHTKDEINEMGFDYFLKYAHPYTINVIGPRFQKFYELADDEKVKGDFQLIKNPKTNVYDTFFTVSKPFKEHKLLLTSSNPVEKLDWVNLKIEKIVGEHEIIRKKFEQFQMLTGREIEILILLASGDTNQRISDKLFVSNATVKQHRKNIKRKTECRNIYELVKFAQAFDLI